MMMGRPIYRLPRKTQVLPLQGVVSRKEHVETGVGYSKLTFTRVELSGKTMGTGYGHSLTAFSLSARASSSTLFITFTLRPSA